MDSQQNKQLVQQGYQFFKDGNIDGLLQLFADDIEWVGSQTEHVPFSGDYHGRKEVAQFFADLANAQDAQMFEPREFIAEDDKVIVIGQGRWTVKATGRTFDDPWCHYFTVRDGKIVRFQEYNDTATIRDAFDPMKATMQPASTGAGTSAIH